MKKSSQLFIFLLLTLIGTSCSETKKEIVISGNLKNLPDGKMALYTRSRQTGKIIPIDTAETHNGQFSFTINKANYPEPISVFLKHHENGTDTVRFFHYKTNLKYQGQPVNEQRFMLEDSIQIEGLLTKVTYNGGFKLPPKIIDNYIDRPIVVGRQTQVMYNDTVGFNPLLGANPSLRVEQVRNLVRQKPYSYYYLYAMERKVANFSNEQFMTIFRSFDAEVQNSPTGQKLLTYVTNRQTKRLTFSTTLADEQGQSQPILDKEARYNLVVLWASWCGPCRQEIPSLKKLYTRLGDSQRLHLVSVSVDEDRQAWLKAMQKEQMPWRQLLMTPSVNMYAKELFQFDGSIPTMLLVDQQGKIVKKVVGYDENNLTAIEAIVTHKK